VIYFTFEGPKIMVSSHPGTMRARSTIARALAKNWHMLDKTNGSIFFGRNLSTEFQIDAFALNESTACQ
jgi:hypothetical protein